ncbi:MAG: glycosyltransferase family 1 protein [Muribaculaceae bacterium]|nr:glycosyltransferase family 1 protein [Muribaculaceae bacterium]
MRILFVGDASNLHNCLAGQLRTMGHDAVVASNGSHWMNTGRDIDLTRRPGKLGAIRYVMDVIKALPQMRGYDIVELSSHIFLDLKPDKVRRVFDYLRRHNDKVVLSALGTDRIYYEACHDGKTYRYSDYRVGNQPSPYVESREYVAQQQDNWRLPVMKRYSDYLLEHIDGVVACLWEYYAAYRPLMGDKVAYAGIPIDVDSLPLRPLATEPDRVRFFVGIQRARTVIKGTDRLLAALQRVHARYPDLCEMEVVENLPYDEYTRRMRASHVLLDQLYSYTPATNALIAMAQGLVAVSGAEPEYYDLIGECDNHPIVNVTPYNDEDIDHQLEHIIEHKSQLPQWSVLSREFVIKHNAAALVAQRHLDFWHKILAS